MSVKNFVQCSLVTPVTASTTQLILNPPVAPYDYPPLTAGTVVIADSVARPSFYEVISYTHRIDNVLYGVTRGKEGTTARNWSGTTWVYQALTAADYVNALAAKAPLASPALSGVPTAPTAPLGTNTTQIATMAAVQAAIAALVQSSSASLDTLNELAAALGNDPNFATTMTAALAGKEPTIVAGTTAQYWAGNKTWQSLMTAVHGLQLTGLSAGSNTAIVTSDTILAALAKLQNQINNKANSNDSRLTDAREWTAESVAQAEAEAGTATTRRAWTAQRVAQAVRGGLLTGLNLTVGTAVSATDTVLGAIGKLQKQITDIGTNLAGNVRATVLTGYVTGSAAALAATDTVLLAFGKLEALVNTKAPLNSPAMTGTPTAPTAAVGTNTTQIATTAFVNAEIANDAPSKTGAGASGSWGISITGSAASASAVAWSGVADKPTTLAGYGITNGYALDGVNSGWFRSSGTQGWYNETYGGGIYMADTTYVRTYNGKQFACTEAIQIDGASPQIRLNDTGWGVRSLYHDAGLIGFLSAAGGWTFHNDNGGNTTAMGNVTAYSDIRLKKDIELIPDALDKVLALRGVTYERIDNGERQTGVIAQEVQAVLPEAVMEGNDEDKTLSVAYGNLAGLLIEAIKELKAELDALKAEREVV